MNLALSAIGILIVFANTHSIAHTSIAMSREELLRRLDALEAKFNS